MRNRRDPTRSIGRLGRLQALLPLSSSSSTGVDEDEDELEDDYD